MNTYAEKKPLSLRDVNVNTSCDSLPVSYAEFRLIPCITTCINSTAQYMCYLSRLTVYM